MIIKMLIYLAVETQKKNVTGKKSLKIEPNKLRPFNTMLRFLLPSYREYGMTQSISFAMKYVSRYVYIYFILRSLLTIINGLFDALTFG